MLTFHVLSSGDEAAFNTASEIYRQAIAASEQKTLEQLQAMWRRPEYRFIVAREPNGAMRGMAVLFQGEGFTLLEYLAVDQSHRSRGIGSGLFQQCAAESIGPMLIEVDDPEPSGEDQKLRRRRVDFYRRLGCRQFERLAYQLPLPTNPPPMGLFAFVPERLTSMSRKVLEGYLRAIYTGVYGQRPDDPRLRTMLEGIGETVRLV